MRRLLLIISLVFFVVPLSAQSDEDDQEQPILDVLAGLRVTNTANLPDLDGRVVRVGVENAYPPFNYVNSEGLGAGWDYNVVPELCERLNCEVEFVELEWDVLLSSVEDGSIDMAADGITVTAEREETVDFSEPYIILRQVLLVRSNEDRFSSIDEFVANEDYILSTQSNTTNSERAIALLGADSPRLVTSENDISSLVLSLISFETDAIIMDSLVAQQYLNEYSDSVRVFEEALPDEEPLGFPFTTDSDLVEPFNLALETMREDGSLDALNTIYLFGFDAE